MSVALDGAVINESTASGHISYKYKESYTDSCKYTDSEGRCVSGTSTRERSATASAKITGTVKATLVSNVFVNGKKVIVVGDRSTEKDQAIGMRSGAYDIRNRHTNANGSVVVGNSKNVFANGKSIAIKSSQIKTHANTTTTFKSGFSQNVII